MEDNQRYRVRRKEFAHGQTGSLNPGRMDTYNPTAFRGFTNPSGSGRDYEQNAGYRENYNRLDTRNEPRQEYRQQDRNGMHKGKGPRSYQRRDDRILEDINDRLCDNPYVDASDIEVSVKDGEVVLHGFVDSREAKRLVEDIGDSISGVKNVENKLRVKIKGI